MLAKDDVVIFGFGAADSTLMKTFANTADKLRQDYTFAHTSASASDEAVINKLGHSDAIVRFRTKYLANKFEAATVTYEVKDDDKGAMAAFIADNKHGMVGHRTSDNPKEFKVMLLMLMFGCNRNFNSLKRIPRFLGRRQ